MNKPSTKVLSRFAAKTPSTVLFYANDSVPGIQRIRVGRGFQYRDSTGNLIEDELTITWIHSLAIPPAWKDVWICERRTGHLQATGRDARGRKQYLYHPEWRAIRDEAKYDRLIDFAKALPRIRRRVAADLARPGIPRAKVLAAIVRLMETSHIRVGNEEYARDNGSFGLTTLRDRHVRVRGARICFDFRGKSGVRHEIELNDARLARIVRECQSLPGQELFQYRDASGRVRDVNSSDVNDYLREISGGDFTAKEFRTWAGTTQAARLLLDLADFSSEIAAKKNVVQVISQVASQLGNTRTVCRKSYIHPVIIETYMNRTLSPFLDSVKRKARKSPLPVHEAGVLLLLEDELVSKTSRQVANQRATSRRRSSRERKRLISK